MKSMREYWSVWNGWGTKVTSWVGWDYASAAADTTVLDNRPIAHLNDPERFARPVSWAVIQMYAARLFKYLDIPPINIVRIPAHSSDRNTLAYYNGNDKVICIYPYGQYATVIKHEICHYLHHIVKGDANFGNNVIINTKIGKMSSEEYHTRTQEKDSWSTIKFWKFVHEQAAPMLCTPTSSEVWHVRRVPAFYGMPKKEKLDAGLHSAAS